MPSKYRVTTAEGTFDVTVDDAPARSDVHQVSASEPDTYWGGFAKSALDTASKAGAGILKGLNPINAVENMATAAWENDKASRAVTPDSILHPKPQTGPGVAETVKSLSDPATGGEAIGNLLLAGGLPRVLPSVPGALSKGGAALERAGTSLQSSEIPMSGVGGAVGYALEGPKGAATGSAIGAAAPRAMRLTGRLIAKAGDAMGGTPPPPAPEVPTGPHKDLSKPSRPGTLTQQQIRERFDAVRAAGGLEPLPTPEKTPLGGRLQMASHPLTEARNAVGADQVARNTPMSPTDVRTAVGSRFGEELGTSSPTMPDSTVQRISLKAATIPRGPERDAFINAATDPKSRAIVHTIVKAIEAHGLSVAGAAGVGRMMTSRDE